VGQQSLKGLQNRSSADALGQDGIRISGLYVTEGMSVVEENEVPVRFFEKLALRSRVLQIGNLLPGRRQICDQGLLCHPFLFHLGLSEETVSATARSPDRGSYRP
jgi:hypothetical protein